MRDPLKTLERGRRYRARKRAEKFGPDAGDMRGRHGNHARGSRNGRWNAATLRSSQGYVLIRVAHGSPHSFGPPGVAHAYAYEHVLVATARIGRLLRDDEVVHHRNGVRDDNRPENLELWVKGQVAGQRLDDLIDFLVTNYEGDVRKRLEQ